MSKTAFDTENQLESTLAYFKEKLSADRMMEDIGEITKHHRIQASTGFRNAALYCFETLKKDGIDVNLRSYKADGKEWHLTAKTFMEWQPKDAKCELVYPEKLLLADFFETPISLIQKSYPADFTKEPIEIVYLEKGTTPASCEKVDLKGKLVFIRESFKKYTWAVKERGALGYITDFIPENPPIRTRENMRDIRSYTSFWWKHTEEEEKAFGFVLSPKLGDQLAVICQETENAYRKDPTKPRYPKASGFVDAKLVPGTIEVVEAHIPGETEEEILVISHLCHPKSSANDNASGVAASMELVRGIHEGKKNGALKGLKRGLRVLLVPEFAGTFAYLSEHWDTRHRFLAGINLDMVGGKQNGDYGPIAITGLPKAASSFVFHIGEHIIKRANEEDPIDIRTGVFEAGSDHYILSDPSVGIPSVMLGQWPDRFYHTSGDTIDKLDPKVLKRSACVAATYVTTLMGLVVEDIPWVIRKCKEHGYKEHWSKGREDKAFDKAEQFGDNKERISYRKSLRDIERFFRIENHPEIQIACGEIDMSDEIKYIDTTERRWKRRFKSPITNIEDFGLGDLTAEAAFVNYEKNHRSRLEDPHRTEALIQFYIDGTRSTEEIMKCVSWESGEAHGEEATEAFIKLMELYKLID